MFQKFIYVNKASSPDFNYKAPLGLGLGFILLAVFILLAPLVLAIIMASIFILIGSSLLTLAFKLWKTRPPKGSTYVVHDYESRRW